MTSRLVIVSNRLPVTLTRSESDASWAFSMSSGGLVSALNGLKETMPFLWIGWPGFELPSEDASAIKTALLQQHSCHPVFLSDAVADLYYNGFSNSILWPLLHYLPSDVTFCDSMWHAYQAANVAFADAVLEVLQDGDLVWVQDYHLMLLPGLLRQRSLAEGRSAPRIGFFLHTPFPSSEIYRALPVRKQLLHGVLQADLLGFHTYNYVRHFLSCCTRILGLCTAPNAVHHEHRLVHVGVFPIGIEPARFAEALDQPAVEAQLAAMLADFAGKRILVGVDRLDYIKGVPQKLQAFGLFLQKYPEYRDKVVLIQVAVPSRTDVPEYQDLITAVNEMVGKINGQYSAFSHVPVHFLNKAIPFADLAALYAAADVCIVTSIRDGMNLVAFEYVACQEARAGVLLLSEFAGAANCLNGAVLLNPWNPDECADAIALALSLSLEERRARHASLLKYVRTYTAQSWGVKFVRELERVVRLEGSKLGTPKAPLHMLDSLLSHNVANRQLTLLIFELDGSVAPISNRAGVRSLSTRLAGKLKLLSESSPHIMLFVASGRSRAEMQLLFSPFPHIGLICEHGAFFRYGRRWQQALANVVPLAAAAAAEADRVLPPPGGIESTTDLSTGGSLYSTTAASISSASVHSFVLLSPAQLKMTEAAASIDVGGHNGSVGLMPTALRPMETETTSLPGLWYVSQAIDDTEKWKALIRPLFQHYTTRTPGSSIEEKESSLVWHFRNAEPEFGAWQAAELQLNLETMLSRLPLRIVPGDRTLEMVPSFVDRTHVVKHVLRELKQEQHASVVGSFGNVIYIGSGKASEDLFLFLKDLKEGISCSVGDKQSEASFFLEDSFEVAQLLDNIKL